MSAHTTMSHIACDSHKKYSLFGGFNSAGGFCREVRVEHSREAFRQFLATLPAHSRIALETTGFYYWIVEEMEAAGHFPLLTNAGKAKKMAGELNKTDKLDVRGLATLLKNGTLPTVWIPPAELRDQRELHRMRMSLTNIRTKLKNRIHSALAKYLVRIEEVDDIFRKKGRKILEARLVELPSVTRESVEQELRLLDEVETEIAISEERIVAVTKDDEMIRLMATLPGVGKILAIVIAREIGDVDRFLRAEKLASYAGTTPRVSSSGGKTRFGPVRPDVNRYLKWAFVEAATCVTTQRRYHPDMYALKLYDRIKSRKAFQVAIMAVARHLAESAFWVLKKGEPYKER